MFTVSELREKVRAYDAEYDNWRDAFLHEDAEPKELAAFEAHTGLPIKPLAYERNNSEYTVRFEIGGRLFEVDGHYDSWSGTDFDEPFDLHEVWPVQKTITVYERKKP